MTCKLQSTPWSCSLRESPYRALPADRRQFPWHNKWRRLGVYDLYRDKSGCRIYLFALVSSNGLSSSLRRKSVRLLGDAVFVRVDKR